MSGEAGGPSRIAAWVAVAALYAAFGAFQAYDYDLPLHLITGESILEDRLAAEKNLFSFTYPGYEWLNDKWLANVVVHLVDRAAGPAGLVAFRMILLLALGLLLRGAMEAGSSKQDPWRDPVIVMMLLLFPFVGYERFTMRPELFSLLGLAGLLWIVARDRRGRADWIAVAALFAVWVNLHGYWFVGVLALGAFFVGDLLESFTAGRGWPADSDPDDARRRGLHRGLLTAAALGGALLSPHPWRLLWNPVANLIFVFGSEGNIATISEMRSPFHEGSVRNWAVLFFFAAAMAVPALMLARIRRVRPSEALLVAGFLTMAAFSRRNIGVFAVVAAVASAWWLLRGERKERFRRASVPAMLGLCVFGLWSTWLVATDRFYISDGTSRRTGFSMSRHTYPAGMADFLLAERPPGPLFNDFASGSYLAYRLYPTYRVFISGNTFKYPPEFFERYYVTSLGREEYRRVAEDYGLQGFALQYAAADMMPLAKRLFNDPDYAVIYFDDNAILFARNTPEMAPFIRKHRVDFAGLARERAGSAPPRTRGWLARKQKPRGELNRATFFHQVGLYPMAEVEYRRALEVDPEIRDAGEGLGEVLLAQGRFGDAQAILAPLLEERPEHAHLNRDMAQVHTGLGSAAAGEERWDDAARDLRKALDLILRARQLDPDGDPMRAIEADNRYNLGYVLWRRDPEDPSVGAEVDRELEAAATLRPTDGRLLYRIARVRARQGRSSEALDLLDAALEHGGAELVRMAPADGSFLSLRGDPRWPEILSRHAPGR